MKQNIIALSLGAAMLLTTPFIAGATESTTDGEQSTSATTGTKQLLPGLSFGGYGEAVFTRNFYSDNVNRYSKAQDYTGKSHGQFDLPHVVLMIGYDFGKGWSMGSEIEFEHGGVESAVEMEQEETGEYEQEVERGGEVALEQFWIQKSFSPKFALRIGHQVVPVGATNAAHLPTEFFTAYRPEGENQIMPCTWHQTGISARGELGAWRYEAMLLPALNSCFFAKDSWVKYGSASPFEFTPANNYAGALRIDNYSVKGLRLSVSGYYGNSFNNTLQSDDGKYKGVTGAVAIGSFDFQYKNAGWVVRGNADYGHLSNADKISEYNRSLSKTSPYKRTHVGKAAWAAALEFGYDIFRLIPSQRVQGQQFYVFGRYEAYDAYVATASAPAYSWTDRQRMAVGVNYYPLKQIVIKAEFSERFLKSQYNNEPSVSLSVAYAGFFL
jgi:hypothetical protein